jgi:hypothetical protein
MVLAWTLLRLLYADNPSLCVMGLFGCTHKSLAMGVPLITAIYEGDPNIGFYTLPLLIWHPLELIIGSSLAPMLSKFVDSESERLSIPVRRSTVGESFLSDYLNVDDDDEEGDLSTSFRPDSFVPSSR